MVLRPDGAGSDNLCQNGLCIEHGCRYGHHGYRIMSSCSDYDGEPLAGEYLKC